MRMGRERQKPLPLRLPPEEAGGDPPSPPRQRAPQVPGPGAAMVGRGGALWWGPVGQVCRGGGRQGTSGSLCRFGVLQGILRGKRPWRVQGGKGAQGEAAHSQA